MVNVQLHTERNKRYVDDHHHSQHMEAHLPVAYLIELHRIIELKAYFLAEKDGYRQSPLDYWLAAENEVQGYP